MNSSRIANTARVFEIGREFISVERCHRMQFSFTHRLSFFCRAIQRKPNKSRSFLPAPTRIFPSRFHRHRHKRREAKCRKTIPLMDRFPRPLNSINLALVRASMDRPYDPSKLGPLQNKVCNKHRVAPLLQIAKKLSQRNRHIRTLHI